MKWNTRFTKIFPCRLPIMGAPMAGASGAQLAAETCRAGGLGFLAAGHLNTKEALLSLEKEIDDFRDISNAFKSDDVSSEDDDDDGTHRYPLCVGFISHSTFASQQGWDLFMNVLENHEPDVVQFFAGSIQSPTMQQTTNAVKVAHSYGCKVVMQVGSVEEAMTAFEYGVDCICAQGSEAGGHGLRRELGSGTLSLTSKLVQLSAERTRPIPILAAGGITDGADVASVLALGADGAVLGTRLWASNEALGPWKFKEALVAAVSGDAVVRTQAFDTLWNSYRTIKWPVPYDSSGALRNRTTKDFGDITKLKKVLNTTQGASVIMAFQKADASDDPELACVFAGKGVGKIYSIDRTYDILMRIEKETAEAIQKIKWILPKDYDSA